MCGMTMSLGQIEHTMGSKGYCLVAISRTGGVVVGHQGLFLEECKGYQSARET